MRPFLLDDGELGRRAAVFGLRPSLGESFRALVTMRGPQCNVCERPLFTSAFLTVPGVAPPMPIGPGSGPRNLRDSVLLRSSPPSEVLVLCVDCATLADRTRVTPVGAEDLRFLVERTGRVVPRSPEAVALAQAFALDGEVVTGWRSEQRAAAWSEAEALAEETGDAAPAERAALLRRRVTAFGFPTVWAVALRSVGDEGGLEAAFDPEYDVLAPNPAPGSPPSWYRDAGDVP